LNWVFYFKLFLQHFNSAAPDEQPPFEFKLQTAKLYIELQVYDAACEILEILIEENDSIAEVWFLLGVVESYSDPEASLESLTKSKQILEKTNCTEPEIFKQVETQIQKVTEKLKANTSTSTATVTMDTSQ